MEALQDGEKRGGERCNAEGSNMDGSNMDGSNVDRINMVRSNVDMSDFVGVLHVEEEPEESGCCPVCAALHLLVHPAHFCCPVSVGVSLCLKRIGDHCHCAWDACCLV